MQSADETSMMMAFGLKWDKMHLRWKGYMLSHFGYTVDVLKFSLSKSLYKWRHLEVKNVIRSIGNINMVKLSLMKWFGNFIIVDVLTQAMRLWLIKIEEFEIKRKM